MKRLQYLFLLFTIWGVVACSYNELPEELSKMVSPIETPIVLNVETRAETYDGKALDQNYFVSEADLENYVRYRRSATKQPNLTVKEVKSYGFDSSQTLFYILNYEKGWEVVSADKRVQPTLAYGDEGTFTMDCDNEPMKFWMNMLASGVLQTRQRTGDSAVATASTASKEESDKADDEEQNVAFWNAISPTQQPNSRGGILTPIPGPLEPIDGIYRYEIDTEAHYTLIDSLPPLLPTRWGQESPWNAFCPRLSSNTQDRVKAGCVPVAGAQLLYYLRTQKGWPIMAPTVVSDPGTLDNPTNMTFSLFNTQIWDEMALNNVLNYSEIQKSNVAKLMAYIGDIVNVNYTSDGSSASYSDFISNMEQTFDMTIDYTTTYSANDVYNTLLNELPVIISATPTQARGLARGHMWLIDGYVTKKKTLICYYATFTTPQTPEFLATLDKYDADYSRTTESTQMYFHMNWGAGGSMPEFSVPYYHSNPLVWNVLPNGSGLVTYSDIDLVMTNFTQN